MTAPTDGFSARVGTALRFDAAGTIPRLRFPLLEAVPGFRHAVTTRLGGRSRGPYTASNVGLAVGDERHDVLTNRGLAASLVVDTGAHPATARQVHGVAALLVEVSGERGVPQGDGDLLATATAGVPLLVQAADCVPLIVLDPAHAAAAVVHAGWRGVAASAGREAVASMARLFGSRPEELLIGIGPAIGPCCYEVGDDVAAAVDRATGTPVSSRGPRGRLHSDLPHALAHQLRAARVRDERIAVASLCTACNADLLYSHRRDGPITGRFAALVAIVG